MRSAADLRLLISRTLRILLVTLAAAVVVCLPFVGRFLDAEDTLERADLIVVLAGARIERWLEGVDLYKEGWAPRMVLSPGPVLRIETALLARGVRYPREGELARDAVLALGVPPDAVILLPDGVDNTAAEAAAVRQMFPPGTIKRIIVVTSTYHVRRAGYAFEREFTGRGVEVLMRGSRYSEAKPSRWWTQRGDIRYIMSELPKFAAYLAGLAE